MPSDTTEDLQRAEGMVLQGDDAVITRAGDLVPGSFDPEANTVDVCFSTGARGLRYDWASDTYYEEELEISTAAVDLTRIEAGVCQVLDSHASYELSDILGIAQRAWIKGGNAMATLKLSARDEISGVVRDIRDGIIRAISVGYRVGTWQRVMPEQRKDGGARILMIAKRWTPHEISFVPVPFDMGASSRALAEPAAQGIPPLDALTAAALARSGGEAAKRPPQSQAITRALQQATAAAAAPVSAPAAPAASTQEEAPMPEQARNEGGANPAAQTPAAPVAQPDVLATERARTAEITELCTRHSLPDLAAAMIRDGITADAAGRKVLDELARRDAAAGGHRNVRVETVTDEHDTLLRGLEEVIATRVDHKAKLTDNGRRFRSMGLLEMGRLMLERSGIRTEGLDRMTLAGRILQHRSPGMMGTSDFGNLLANVANKRLRNGYEENPGSYQRWARRAPNAPDFKTQTIVQMAAMPDLLQVNEAGEFKYGSISDGAETYALATFGRVVSFTRQAMVNDDLRGFDRVITGFGASAARLENRTVYAQLTANAALSDTVALFHATHANLQTGGGSALQFSAMVTARTAMRLQKGLQSEELSLAPAFLIVPAALEQTSYQLTSSNYVPATQSTVNEFRQGGRTSVEPIVEPILDANSSTAWYFAANTSQVDTVEYCYLDGADGPVIETDMGFDVDGMSIKCRLDFAAKALDFRGLNKSAGV